MHQAKELMAAFLISDEGKRQFKLIWLQDSPLLGLLRVLPAVAIVGTFSTCEIKVWR